MIEADTECGADTSFVAVAQRVVDSCQTDCSISPWIYGKLRVTTTSLTVERITYVSTESCQIGTLSNCQSNQWNRNSRFGVRTQNSDLFCFLLEKRFWDTNWIIAVSWIPVTCSGNINNSDSNIRSSAIFFSELRSGIGSRFYSGTCKFRGIDSWLSGSNSSSKFFVSETLILVEKWWRIRASGPCSVFSGWRRFANLMEANRSLGYIFLSS